MKPNNPDPTKQSFFTAMLIGGALFLALVGVVVFSATGDDSTDDGASDASPTASERRPAPEPITLASGTTLTLQLRAPLSSETSQIGERFTARVMQPVEAGGNVAIPQGSIVEGQVIEVVPSKKIGGTAALGLRFDTLRMANDEAVPISATYRAEGLSQVKKDSATIAGSTAGGAVLGRIVGHQKDNDARGTAAGAVVGAAVGTAVAAKNKRDPVVLPQGATMVVRLQEAVTIDS